MGQKVNPHGARVGVIFNWSTRWYAGKKDFAKMCIRDRFLNSVDRGVRLMQTAGVGAKVSRRDTEDAICLTVTIPRAKPQKEVS